MSVCGCQIITGDVLGYSQMDGHTTFTRCVNPKQPWASLKLATELTSQGVDAVVAVIW